MTVDSSDAPPPPTSSGESAPEGGTPELTFSNHPYTPAVIVLLVAAFLIALAPLLPRPEIPKDAPPPPPVVTSNGLPAEAPLLNSVGIDQIPPEAQAAWALVFGVWSLGAVCCVSFVVLRLFSPQVRALFPLQPKESRPLPAVLLVDLIAVIALLVGLLSAVSPLALNAWHAAGGPFDAAAVLVLSLLIQFLGYGGAVLAVVWSARRRAGPSGSASLWPVWRTEGLQPPRNISGDVALGTALYVLCSWIVLAGMIANAIVVTKFGLKPEQNPIVDIIAAEVRGPARMWVVAGLAVAAAIGAAFFEELLFRGVLYNVLKRNGGTIFAALGSSLIFAAVHKNVSQVLPLFILSLLLTYAYERSGRLLASIVLHALNNGVTLLLLIWTYGG